jgi:hypothetical protein
MERQLLQTVIKSHPHARGDRPDGKGAHGHAASWCRFVTGRTQPSFLHNLLGTQLFINTYRKNINEEGTESSRPEIYRIPHRKASWFIVSVSWEKDF